MKAAVLVALFLVHLGAVWGLIGPSQMHRSVAGLARSSVLRGLKDDMLARKGALVPDNIADVDSAQFPPSNLNALLLVPVVWGSYSPVVKSIYNNADLIPPPVLIFNLGSYLVSLTTLLVASIVADSVRQNSSESWSTGDVEKVEEQQASGGNEASIGAELGMYLFAGSTLQVAGIQQVSAIKAAVLVQCTTIVVPLLESLLTSTKLSTNILSACLIALCGVLLISIDDPLGLLSNHLTDGSFDPSAAFEKADLYILGATLFYSMHVVRLSRFAAETKPLKLARYKSATELVACAVAVAVALLASTGASGGEGAADSLVGAFGKEIRQYASSLEALPSLSSQTPLVQGALWNGALATALTTYLQTVGQRSVSATTANVIYSSQPIWATLFSFFFLGERVTPTNAVGAGLLCVAVFLAASSSSENAAAED